MQIERDELCRIIEGSAPIRDELTGIPLGSQVEALADKIIASLSARPAVGEDVVERVALAIAKVWYGPDFNPFSAPEYYDMAQQCASAAIAAMGSADMGKGEG